MDEQRQVATTSTTPWSFDIDRMARSGTVLRVGRVVGRFPVIVGAAATPMPIGRYFVEETVRLMRGAVAGPFALALRARSSVLRECGRGPGQIALHGRVGLGGIMRSAVSHGRVRLADPDIRWLVARIGPGGPRHHPHRSVRVAAAARDADEHRGAVAIRLRGRPAGW